MAIDTTSLSEIITDFRALRSKDSITPEALGSILQRISDLLATAGSDDVLSEIQELFEKFKAATYVVMDISQGITDKFNIMGAIKKISLTSGTTTSTMCKIAANATNERAGAMTAQHVIDLTNAQKSISSLNKTCELLNQSYSDLEEALQKLKKSITKITSSSTVQISVRNINNILHVQGFTKLSASDCVPYIFRWSKKRNRYKVKDSDRKKGYISKGWHLYGSCYAAKIFNDVLAFSTNQSNDLHQEAEDYSTNPTNLVRVYIDKYGNPAITWGMSKITLCHKMGESGRNRMLRLRFALGFGPKILPGSVPITPANMLSSLAEFEVVYDPIRNLWEFGR